MTKHEFRDYLINNSSPAEKKLIDELNRDNNLIKKYEFQKIFNPYIVDFYFKHLNLAVELDGRSHKNKEKYDDERTMYLKRVYRVNIIRFENKLVFNSPHIVIAKIKTFVHDPGFSKTKKYRFSENKYPKYGWFRLY